MLYVTVEAIVSRRPEIVWDVLTDVAALPAWVEGLVEAEVVGESARGVGMQVRVARRDRRARRGVRAATCEVTAWRPHALLAVETRLPGLLLLDRVTLAPSAEGTELGFYAELVFGSLFTEFFARPRGLLGAAQEDPALVGIYERSVESFIKRVETVSEVPYR